MTVLSYGFKNDIGDGIDHGTNGDDGTSLVKDGGVGGGGGVQRNGRWDGTGCRN